MYADTEISASRPAVSEAHTARIGTNEVAADCRREILPAERERHKLTGGLQQVLTSSAPKISFYRIVTLHFHGVSNGVHNGDLHGARFQTCHSRP